jgi:hypothetical protein
MPPSISCLCPPEIKRVHCTLKPVKLCRRKWPVLTFGQPLLQDAKKAVTLEQQQVRVWLLDFNLDCHRLRHISSPAIRMFP